MHGHTGGDKEGLNVATHVLGVDEVTVTDAIGEFLAELVERLVALVSSTLKASSSMPVISETFWAGFG